MAPALWRTKQFRSMVHEPLWPCCNSTTLYVWFSPWFLLSMWLVHTPLNVLHSTQLSSYVLKQLRISCFSLPPSHTHTHSHTCTHTIRPPSHMHTPTHLSTLPPITVQTKGEGLSGYYSFLSQFGCHVWIQSRAMLMFDSHTGKPSYIVCINFVIWWDCVCVWGRTWLCAHGIISIKPGWIIPKLSPNADTHIRWYSWWGCIVHP